MQMITSRTNKINDVIISFTATIYYNYKSSVSWEEMYDICEGKKHYKSSMMRCGSCTAKLKSIFRINWTLWGTNDPQTAIHYLKSLYRPYHFRRKLMKELFILMRPLRLYEDNPTTLISKCMPQYWLISLKSLYYESMINPSRIFTYHGGWSLRLRLSTNTHAKPKQCNSSCNGTITTKHQKQLSK